MTTELERVDIDWTQWHTVSCEWITEGSTKGITLSIDGKEVSYKDASYIPATPMRMIHQEPEYRPEPYLALAWPPPAKAAK